MLVKTPDRNGIDDADTLEWRELAAQRLARLVESEYVHSALQIQIEHLRQDYCHALATIHGQTQQIHALEKQLKELEQQQKELEEQLKSCRAELAVHRPVSYSWWGRGWRLQQQVRDPAERIALGKRLIARPLRLVARIRLLRRFVGAVLRVTPQLRARLVAMIGPI